MDSEIDVVVAMAGAWSAWQDEPSFPFAPDHCINGTRVVTLALAKLGVKARPLSVHFMLFNQQAWDLWHHGIPFTEWPPQAWSLGVHPEMPTKGRSEGWDGHLVAEGAGWTLDISARNFNRPGKIVSTEPIILLENLPRVGIIVVPMEHHQQLVIGRWAKNSLWREASGWLRLHRSEVKEIVQRTEALLATERNSYG